MKDIVPLPNIKSHKITIFQTFDIANSAVISYLEVLLNIILLEY